MKNNHIISALGICHKEFAYSFDGYKKQLKDILEKEDATNYLTQLKSEVKQALVDPKWSWKEAAKEANFCYYDESRSEEENFAEIKNLPRRRRLQRREELTQQSGIVDRRRVTVPDQRAWRKKTTLIKRQPAGCICSCS